MVAILSRLRANSASSLDCCSRRSPSSTASRGSSPAAACSVVSSTPAASPLATSWARSSSKRSRWRAMNASSRYCGCVMGAPLIASRTNADDRLAADPLGRVESGDGIIEARDVADVGPQSTVPHALDDLVQLAAIGLDHEVDRQTVGGPCLGRSDDRHQCSAGANQASGSLLDVAADDIEHQIDAADVFQRVVVEIDELLRAEVEHLLAIGGAPGADDVGARFTRELRDHRSDGAGRAVRDDALP